MGFWCFRIFKRDLATPEFTRGGGLCFLVCEVEMLSFHCELSFSVTNKRQLSVVWLERCFWFMCPRHLIYRLLHLLNLFRILFFPGNSGMSLTNKPKLDDNYCEYDSTWEEDESKTVQTEVTSKFVLLVCFKCLLKCYCLGYMR